MDTFNLLELNQSRSREREQISQRRRSHLAFHAVGVCDGECESRVPLLGLSSTQLSPEPQIFLIPPASTPLATNNLTSYLIKKKRGGRGDYKL